MTAPCICRFKRSRRLPKNMRGGADSTERYDWRGARAAVRAAPVRCFESWFELACELAPTGGLNLAGFTRDTRRQAGVDGRNGADRIQPIVMHSLDASERVSCGRLEGAGP